MARLRTRLHGTVQRIIKPILWGETELAEIRIAEAEALSKEILIDSIVLEITAKTLVSSSGPRRCHH